MMERFGRVVGKPPRSPKGEAESSIGFKVWKKGKEV